MQLAYSGARGDHSSLLNASRASVDGIKVNMSAQVSRRNPQHNMTMTASRWAVS